MYHHGKPIETDPGQPKQSTLGNPHTNFGNQNVENETQNITNHKKQAVEMSKDHNSEIQEKRHANKTEEQRKRERNGTNQSGTGRKTFHAKSMPV